MFDIPDSGTTNIDFSLTYDGILANLSSDGYIHGVSRIFMLDVTDATTYFNGALLNINAPAPYVGCANVELVVKGASYTTPAFFPPDYPMTQAPAGCSEYRSTTINSLGDVQSYGDTLNGSFTVTADRIYLLQLLSWVRVGGDAGVQFRGSGTGDFSHTSTFRITDLGGATGFTSSSGQFLSSQVPEPGTWLLSGLGLLGVALRAAKRHNRL